jgi:hypothetical protein
MGQVVQEREEAGKPDATLVNDSLGVRVSVDGVDHLLCHRERAEGMLEAVMNGATEDEVARPELLDPGEPLELRRVENLQLGPEEEHAAGRPDGEDLVFPILGALVVGTSHTQWMPVG